MTISRDYFDETKGWTGAVIQEGVPVMDADLNVQADIGRWWLRRVVTELLGNGSPDSGFALEGDPADPTLKAGALYLGGYRLFLPEDTLFSQQPFGTSTPPAGDGLWLLALTEEILTSSEEPLLRDERLPPAVETPIQMRRLRWTVQKVFGTTLPAAPDATFLIGLALESGGQFTDMRNTGMVAAGAGLHMDFPGQEGGRLGAGHTHLDEEILVAHPAFTGQNLESVLDEIDTRLDTLAQGGQPPTAHGDTHEAGGPDPIDLGLLTGNLTAAQHGVLPTGDPHPQYITPADLVAGSGITLALDQPGPGQVTLSATGGGGGALRFSDLLEEGASAFWLGDNSATAGSAKNTGLQIRYKGTGTTVTGGSVIGIGAPPAGNALTGLHVGVSHTGTVGDVLGLEVAVSKNNTAGNVAGVFVNGWSTPHGAGVVITGPQDPQNAALHGYWNTFRITTGLNSGQLWGTPNTNPAHNASADLAADRFFFDGWSFRQMVLATAPSGGGGGVTSLEGLTGAVNLQGAGGIAVTTVGQDVTITGPDLSHRLSDHQSLPNTNLYHHQLIESLAGNQMQVLNVLGAAGAAGPDYVAIQAEVSGASSGSATGIRGRAWSVGVEAQAYAPTGADFQAKGTGTELNHALLRHENTAFGSGQIMSLAVPGTGYNTTNPAAMGWVLRGPTSATLTQSMTPLWLESGYLGFQTNTLDFSKSQGFGLTARVRIPPSATRGTLVTLPVGGSLLANLATDLTDFFGVVVDRDHKTISGNVMGSVCFHGVCEVAVTNTAAPGDWLIVDNAAPGSARVNNSANVKNIIGKVLEADSGGTCLALIKGL